MLSEYLNFHQDDIQILARSWLESGASSFSLWEADQVLASWPRTDKEPASIEAAIMASSEGGGRLRVSGLTGPASQKRLEAEAAMISQVLDAEAALDGMTDELIEKNDQLVALYDLTKSMRSQLDIEKALKTLAVQAHRMVVCEHATAFLVTADDRLIMAQAKDQRLDERSARALLMQAKEHQRPIILSGRESRPINGAGLGMQTLGIDQVLLVPIPIKGECRSVLVLTSKRGTEFTSPDMKLAQAMAEQAGAQIENAQMHAELIDQAKLQAEMQLAKDVQLRLLPRDVPVEAGIEIFAASQPALDVGGDFYDFIHKGSDQALVFTLGDVSGKGISAALLMSRAQMVLHKAARFMPEPSPMEILNRANDDLYEDFTEVGMFATVFVGEFDRETRTLGYANAGHSPVIYYPADGEAQILKADGVPLGVLPINFCEDHRIRMEPGDIMVVATDGFSETRSPDDEMFGYDRLLRLLEEMKDLSAESIACSFYDAIHTFSNNGPQDDDETLVVVKGAA
jgi:sigma-B regulation protein RsbU (phosphoserine phosphatase)